MPGVKAASQECSSAVCSVSAKTKQVMSTIQENMFTLSISIPQASLLECGQIAQGVFLSWYGERPRMHTALSLYVSSRSLRFFTRKCMKLILVDQKSNVI